MQHRQIWKAQGPDLPTTVDGTIDTIIKRKDERKMSEPHKWTNRQIKDLKKSLREDPDTEVYILQRRPNTFALVKIRIGEGWMVDFGFSKVNWPDWFNARRGAEIATGKALDALAERILGGGEKTVSIQAEENAFKVSEFLSGLVATSDVEDDLNPLLVGA
jgi:hypothetical protein